MKLTKLLIVAAACSSGCATYQPGTYQVGPYQVQPGQMVPQPVAALANNPGQYLGNQANSIAGAMVTQPVNDPFILANQLNQLISGVMGPNNVSGAILTGQNYYRDGLAIANNPWIGMAMLRNQWVK